MKLGENIAADEEGRGEQQNTEQAVPEHLSAMLEQADVLIVVGLEDETHQLFLMRMISSDLPTPAEALIHTTGMCQGFAQAGNRCPLFGIMRYTFFRIVSPKMPDGMNNSTASTTT
jgi:hypothetical protein